MIDFKLDSGHYYIYSENVDGSVARDYYEEICTKQISKRSNVNCEQVLKCVICDVIKNSLAHENINGFFHNESGETFIEFKDIDSKNDRLTRVLQMIIKRFNKFLRSVVFCQRIVIKII